MKVNIWGAIIGDTIGSVYEFDPVKKYDFELYRSDMSYTDDSIMTIAVADWLLNTNRSSQELADKMRHWGRKYRYPPRRIWKQFR